MEGVPGQPYNSWCTYSVHYLYIGTCIHRRKRQISDFLYRTPILKEQRWSHSKTCEVWTPAPPIAEIRLTRCLLDEICRCHSSRFSYQEEYPYGLLSRQIVRQGRQGLHPQILHHQHRGESLPLTVWLMNSGIICSFVDAKFYEAQDRSRVP